MIQSLKHEPTSLIDQFMPAYRFKQILRIRVKAPPSETWTVVRDLDTNELFISRVLFALRSIPTKLKSHTVMKTAPRTQSKIDDFTGPTKGFQILGENTGREIVIGAIGKFWQPNILFQSFSPENFFSFNSPGFGKLVWNLKIDPDSHGGSWVSWDLRVTSTDEESWKTFRKYWFLIGRFSHLLRKTALQHFQQELGSYENEEEFRLAGDSIIARPLYQKTLSEIIEGPPENLWPWLVQMGCHRAGWYSIDILDNGGVKSATTIIPELQNLKEGDILPWRPKGQEGFHVLTLQKNRHLILGSQSKAQDQKAEVENTWAFILEPIGQDATCLITRVRANFEPTLKMKSLLLWLKGAHYIMEKAQLRHLKKRVEKSITQKTV